MKKEELIEWFTNDFWPAYLGLMKVPQVTKWNAGNKGEALKKMLTINPTKELRIQIINGLAAQMSHRRTLFNKCGSMQAYIAKTDSNRSFYANRQGKTWLFNLGWTDEIPSITETKSHTEQFVENPCSTQGCNNPIHGPNFKVCGKCLHKNGVYDEELRTYLRNNELTKAKGETAHEYAMKCKASISGIKDKILTKSKELLK